MVRTAEGDPLEPVFQAIAAGGDTDTNAAIAGALVGALLGPRAVPDELLRRVHDGPFGPTHLRALGAALNGLGPLPTYSRLYALVRNLALYPVILAHGFRRLLP